MDFQDIIPLIRGTYSPVFGVNFNPTPSEVARARGILEALQSHRFLTDPYQYNEAHWCAQSVTKIKDEITRELDAGKLSKNLAASLMGMRAACYKCVDGLASSGLATNRALLNPPGVCAFCDAIGELRGVLGMYIAVLAVAYGLEVRGDFNVILPIGDVDPYAVYKGGRLQPAAKPRRPRRIKRQAIRIGRAAKKPAVQQAGG